MTDLTGPNKLTRISLVCQILHPSRPENKKILKFMREMIENAGKWGLRRCRVAFMCCLDISFKIGLIDQKNLKNHLKGLTLGRYLLILRSIAKNGLFFLSCTSHLDFRSSDLVQSFVQSRRTHTTAIQSGSCITSRLGQDACLGRRRRIAGHCGWDSEPHGSHIYPSCRRHQSCDISRPQH